MDASQKRITELLKQLDRAQSRIKELENGNDSVSETASVNRLLNACPGAMLIIDKHNIIVSANEVACSLLELSQDRLQSGAYSLNDWTLSSLDKHPLLPEEHPWTVVKESGKAIRDIRFCLSRNGHKNLLLCCNLKPIPDSDTLVMGLETLDEHLFSRNDVSPYQSRLDQAEVIFLRLDLDERVTMINHKGCRILGRTQQEVIGKKWFDCFIVERDREACRKLYRKLLQGNLKNSSYHESTVVTYNGLERTIAWHNVFITDEQGEVSGTLSSGHDITEERLAEHALRESEEKFFAIFQHSVDAVTISDLNGYVVGYNPAMQHLFGVEAAKYSQGRHFSSFIAEEDREQAIKNAFLLRNIGHVPNQQLRFLRSNDDSFLGELSTWTIDDRTGTPKYVIGIIKDITQQQQNRQEQEKLTALVENSTDFIGIADLHGQVTYLNPSGMKMVGIKDAQQVQKLKIIDFLPVEEQPFVLEGVLPKAVEHDSFAGEGILRHFQTGERIPIRFNTFVIRSKLNGEPRFIAVVISDIRKQKKAEAERLQSEERLSYAMDATREGIWDLDTKSGVAYFSPRFYTMLGYQPGEFTPTVENWLRLIHPEDHDEALAAFSSYMESPTGVYEQVFRMVCSDGSHIWILGRGKTVEWDEQGKPKRMIGTHLDISDHMQREHLLRESEQRYRLLFESANDMIMLVSQWGMCLDVNPRIEDILGIAPKEIVGHHVAYLAGFIKQDIYVLKKEMEQLIESGLLNQCIEVECTHRNGYTVWVEVHMARVLTDGKHSGMLVDVRDITEQKRAEKEVQAKEAQFRNIINSSPVGVLLFEENTDGEVVFADSNPTADYLTQRDLSELIGLSLRNAFPGLNDPHVFKRLEQIAKGGPPLEKQLAYQGTIVSGHFEIFAFNISPGQMAVMFFEISDRIRAEEEKARLEEQLRQSQKMEAVGRLAGGIAHDFNNLLTGINGNISLAQMDLEQNNPLHETMNEITRAADRAADLTRQLLAFSRKQIIQPKIINLNDQIRGLSKMLKRIIGEDIELTLDMDSKLGQVRVDPGQMEQIIVNLAVNARDAMPNGGKLILRTANVTFHENQCRICGETVSGEHVRLQVQDNGIGIDEEDRKRIFDPFFTTKPEGKGTGLGLATVFGIVKQHKGHIHVISSPENGTTFEILLPKVSDHADSAPRKQGLQRLPKGNEVILLAEDEPVVRNIAVRTLTKLGYKVLEAENGEHALNVAKDYDGPIDLLLTDVIMPKKNGRELADALCALRPELPVLFTSGYTQDTIGQHGVLDRGIHFLEKPYTPSQLALKVRELLDNLPERNS